MADARGDSGRRPGEEPTAWALRMIREAAEGPLLLEVALLEDTVRTLVAEIEGSTGRLSLGADLVTEQDRLLSAAGKADAAVAALARERADRG